MLRWYSPWHVKNEAVLLMDECMNEILMSLSPIKPNRQAGLTVMWCLDPGPEVIMGHSM